MSEPPPSPHAYSILVLLEVRRFLRESHARMMVVFFAVLYALGSMVLGGMLILTHVPGGYTSEIIWGNALGSGVWNYPGYLLVAPWGIVSLPFLAFWSMVYVAIGVGLGTSVAILISVRLVRDLRRASAQPGAVGTIAGLTPAMIALVTLGACCSTTAAATAGVGLVAQASGSSVGALLVNNWYLDLFQVAVLTVALYAQEMLLEVYGGLFGLRPRDAGEHYARAAPRWNRRTWATGVLRGLLLVSGVTWSLAMFAEWTTTSPFGASGALWFQWIVQHQLLAGLAVAVALFPAATVGFLVGTAGRPAGIVLRVALIVGGTTLAIGVPPPLAGAAVAGFVNEVLGALGLPAAWGAVAPVFAPGLTLYLRWAFQYLLVGGFAIAVAVGPRRTFGFLGWAAGPMFPDDELESGATARLGQPPALSFPGLTSVGSDRPGSVTAREP